ncbi:MULTISPECIES: DUF6282 family protein [Actinomadura]|uniref:Phosphotriesterase family protein n=2 Tax=Actinomadura madurae TaxID=1993 RepID=A0A1I5F472_9ACTN|nr:DUF6282 family protein [Actinomadura madurae]SFO18527.1 Phosphotriesterase family protein [Actinomadura madurae]SPT60211.1 Uncharacterised protein [Actinomadura madurae]
MADEMADDQPPAPPLDVAALPDGFDRLLRDAVDVHVHGRPDLSAAFHYRGDDLAVARLAHAYGIAGWVLKSHLWITTDRAGMLRRQVADLGFEVHGSITLNPPMGGVCATVVELAAAHGARVVFLPTWGSDADTGRNGYISKLLGRVSPSFDEYGRRNAVSLLASGGTLTGQAREAVDACRDLGLSLATGHVSLEESEAVARYCADIGQRLMITHPMHYTADAGRLRELAALGAYIEFCNGPLLHPDSRHTIRDVHDMLSAIGPERSVLSTDAFSRWAPSEPECLRIFVEQLAYLGWRPDELRRMTVDNPRAFLGAPGPVRA